MLLTFTGLYFDYDNITKDSISIEDITRSLPRLNRFVGHSARAYSVGEHSILCYQMAKKLGYSTREQLLTLIHDFTEAYVSDCPSPLKRLLPDFSLIEAEVEVAICDYLNIDPPTDEEYWRVKAIDMTMLVLEMRDLTEHEFENFIDESTHLDIVSDKSFAISKKDVKESDIRESLEQSFFEAYTKYKGEYGYGN